MTIVFAGVAVLILAAIALVLYCALVDGARRRRYQDRVAEEWLARKDEGRAAVRLIDADALPWQVLWAWRAGEEVCAVTVDDIDNVPTVCCAECEYGPPPADAAARGQPACTATAATTSRDGSHDRQAR